MGPLQKVIAKHLRKPGTGPVAWFVKKHMLKVNLYLEKNAVRLCGIEPPHRVLEVGFGHGIGLRYACQAVQDGPGKVYGVDHSETIVAEATKRYRRELEDDKLELILADVENLPFNSDMFDRIFHVNSFLFWTDIVKATAELHRVMKPDSLLVCTMNLERIKQACTKGRFGTFANPDPIHCMWALETVGFNNVTMKYFEDESEGKKYQAIFAEVLNKNQSSSVES